MRRWNTNPNAPARQTGGRPLPVPKPTQKPTGPKFVPRVKDPSQSGPGNPPPGFLSASTSKDEWPIFWALTKILGPEGERWRYQAPILGGRHRAGGLVADFVIVDRRPYLVLRSVGERYHISVSSQRQAYDSEQKAVLERQGYEVIDLYAEDYLRGANYETGQAVIKLIWMALNGRQMPGPIETRTSMARG